jgi:hypothetical protein
MMQRPLLKNAPLGLADGETVYSFGFIQVNLKKR